MINEYIKTENILNEIKNNDLSMAEELINRYAKMIRTVIIKRFYIYPKDQHFDDLLQEGYITVIKCAREFDFNKGVNFTTYLYNALLRTLDRKLSEMVNIIHIPYYNYRLMMGVYQFKKELGYTPSETEIKEHFDLTDSEYNNLAKCYTSVISLSTPVKKSNNETPDTTLEEIISDKNDKKYDIIEESEITKRISNIAKEILSPTEYAVLKLRGLFDIESNSLTYLEIADICGFTKQRCHQLANNAKQVLSNDNRIRKLLGVEPIETKKGGKKRKNINNVNKKVQMQNEVIAMCFEGKLTIEAILEIIKQKNYKKIS